MTTIREYLEAIAYHPERNHLEAPDQIAHKALTLINEAPHGWYDEDDGSVRVSEGGLPGEIRVCVVPDPGAA